MRITPDDKTALDDILTRIENYKSISAEIKELCIRSITRLAKIENGEITEECRSAPESTEIPTEIEVTLTEGMGRGMTIRVPVHGEAQRGGVDYWVSIGQDGVKLYPK